jgi:hypothetical protein
VRRPGTRSGADASTATHVTLFGDASSALERTVGVMAGLACDDVREHEPPRLGHVAQIALDYRGMSC